MNGFSERVKIALILVGGALIVTAALLYFSPYQSCVRSVTGSTYSDGFGVYSQEHERTEAEAALICRRSAR